MGKRELEEEEKLKKVVYVFMIVLLVSIVIFISLFTAYNRKLREESNSALINLGKEEKILDNSEIEDTNPVSYSSDLSVADRKSTNSLNVTTSNKTDNTNVSNKSNQNINENAVMNTSIDNSINTNNTNTINNTEDINNNKISEENALKFMAPVSGEIIKDFAVDSLVFSNTLMEWTTHNGIDIKADKTSIVKASESGIINSIKNDPRYGLTIIIEHDDGFKTVYSNLLTTEFVKENENVEKGQTIATVGESASFEVADVSHLHFEMYKDGEIVNPTIYLKDI